MAEEKKDGTEYDAETGRWYLVTDGKRSEHGYGSSHAARANAGVPDAEDGEEHERIRPVTASSKKETTKETEKE